MPKFEKRHIEALAEAVQAISRRLRAEQGTDGLVYLSQVESRIQLELARMLLSGNGAFQQERFYRACEPGANVETYLRNDEGALTNPSF